MPTKAEKRRKDGTPASRVRSRRDPAVGLPPKPPTTERDLDSLKIHIAGKAWRIGRRLTPAAEVELTMDGASMLTLVVSDPDGRLLRLLESDSVILEQGVRVNLDDVDYMLDNVSIGEDGTLTLTLYDEVMWRFAQHNRHISRRRSVVTRAEFVKLLVDEVGKSPAEKVVAYIPEISDVQPIA